MNPPPNADAPGLLARITPDSRRRRRVVAALAAVAAPLALYGSWAVASGVKSGMTYDLIILLFSAVALLAPAFAAMALLAPDAGRRTAPEARPGPSVEEADPVTVLQRRYAAGELSDEEFDRRLETVLETDEIGQSPAERRSAGGRQSAAETANRGVERDVTGH